MDVNKIILFFKMLCDFTDGVFVSDVLGRGKVNIHLTLKYANPPGPIRLGEIWRVPLKQLRYSVSCALTYD